jgi:hypothetical protein
MKSEQATKIEDMMMMIKDIMEISTCTGYSNGK